MEMQPEKPRIRRMQFAIAELSIETLFEEEFDLYYVLRQAHSAPLSGWVIGDVEKVKDEKQREFIFARLGKTKVGVRTPKFDKREARFKSVTIPAETAYYTNFVLYHERHDTFRMAIQETSQIPLKKFRRQFNALVKSTSEKEIGDIKLQETTEDIVAVLRSFSSIERAYFKRLRVPNPKSDPEFKTLELMMRDSNTDEANLELKGGEKGLRPDEGLMKQATRMAEAGYGTAKYVGERFFKKVVFSFEDRVIRFVGKMADSAKEIVHQVAVLLVGEDNERDI